MGPFGAGDAARPAARTDQLNERQRFGLALAQDRGPDQKGDQTARRQRRGFFCRQIGETAGELREPFAAPRKEETTAELERRFGGREGGAQGLLPPGCPLEVRRPCERRYARAERQSLKFGEISRHRYIVVQMRQKAPGFRP